MAELVESIDALGNLFSRLRTMAEPRGVEGSPRDSVVNDSIGRKDVDANLSANETSRIQKSGEILADIFAKTFKLGKYAEKEKRLEDLTPEKLKQAVPTTAITQPKVEKKEGGLLDLLASLFPFLGALKGLSLKGIFTALGAKLGAWLKSLNLGAKIKKLFNRIGSGLWSMIKGAGKFILGPFIWLNNKITTWLKTQGEKIRNLFKPLTSRASTLFNSVKSGITGFANSIREGMNKALTAAKNALTKIPGVGKAIEKILPSAGGAVGGVATTAAAEAGEEAAKKGFTGRALEWGKRQITKFFDKFFNTTPGLLGKALKRIPVIGTILEGFSFKGDIDKLKKEFAEGAMSQEDLTYRAGRRVVEGIAGIAGATLGGALGTALGPVGSILGAVGGDILSRWAAGQFVDKLTSPSITRGIGSYIVGGEMQDFLIKNNNVYPFSSKDEILGMKTGGAVDGLLRDLTQSLAQDNSIIARASTEQVEKLNELIHLMRSYLSKVGEQVSAPLLFPNQPSSGVMGFSRASLNERTLIA